MSLRRSTRLRITEPVPVKPDLESPATTNTKKKSNTMRKRKVDADAEQLIKVPKTSSARTKETTQKQKRSNAFAVPVMPETPNNKRRKTATKASPVVPPHITPTPSAVGLMSSPANGVSATHAVSRPAEPHATNAPLQTPGGARIVAYSEHDHPLEESPSKQSPVVIEGSVPPLPRPTTTTDNLLEEACAHLCKVDPRLKVVIEKYPCRIFSPEGLQEEVDPFRSLASGIMAQQVSGAAASSIKKKFIALFSNTTFPTPAQVAAADLSLLRTAGLSQRKAEYIKGLAEKFASGELSAQMLVQASDEEVLEKLTAVRGLGKWSVEMFACFGLKRMDVFSTGDLGVQRGMAAWLGRDVAKLKAKGGNNKWKYLSEKEMLEHSAKFAPYRSLFMWYMWRIEDVKLDAIQDA